MATPKPTDDAHGARRIHELLNTLRQAGLASSGASPNADRSADSEGPPIPASPKLEELTKTWSRGSLFSEPEVVAAMRERVQQEKIAYLRPDQIQMAADLAEAARSMNLAPFIPYVRSLSADPAFSEDTLAFSIWTIAQALNMASYGPGGFTGSRGMQMIQESYPGATTVSALALMVDMLMETVIAQDEDDIQEIVGLFHGMVGGAYTLRITLIMVSLLITALSRGGVDVPATIHRVKSDIDQGNTPPLEGAI